MASTTNNPVEPRPGDALRLGRELVSFGRNVLTNAGTSYAVQHRLFLIDPWELIAEAIHRSVPDLRTRDIAHSFRRQAEDYFRAATVGRDIAVRPVLLYYAFLNLSKAYAIAKGEQRVISVLSWNLCNPKCGTILGTPIRFDLRKKPAVFEELLQLLGGDATILKSDCQLGRLMPQILPGHRLWCYATNQSERFLAIEYFDLLHSGPNKQVWLNMWINRNGLDPLDLSEKTALSHSGLSADVELVSRNSGNELVCFQQKEPSLYLSDPGEALEKILRRVRNQIWETVKIVSPYRKSYTYCSPLKEHGARLPQISSIYLLMFFLGSITRYFPEYFEDLFESKYGPFFQTFISESPMQFLYLMASEILEREVSKPAIV